MSKIVFLVCLSIMFSMQANAQIWLYMVGQKAVNTAKQKVENRVAKKAGEAADKALDNLEGKGNEKTETEETVEGTKKMELRTIKRVKNSRQLPIMILWQAIK